MIVTANNEVHVTGYGSSPSTPNRWLTRQRSAVTGLWSTTDDFATASSGIAEGRAITADPFGNVFAAGVATYPPDNTYGWVVRRKLATAP